VSADVHSLPPYNPTATCPKCGHDDVRTFYVAEHKAWSTPGCGLLSLDKYQEHLDRCCQRCHYEWAEAVLEPPHGAAAEGGE
jgi:transcription elongation factor Elf1